MDWPHSLIIFYEILSRNVAQPCNYLQEHEGFPGTTLLDVPDAAQFAHNDRNPPAGAL